MRVTLPMKYDRIVNDLSRKNTQLEDLAAQISSGKRILRPSDDPLSWVKAMNIKKGLQELDALQSNVDYAIHWNRAAENTLDHLSELFVSAKEVAIAAMGAPSGEGDFARMEQLDQIFQQALALANTSHENRFLFAVNSSHPPFVFQAEEQELVLDPELGDSFSVRIGYGLFQEQGLNGGSLFIAQEEGDALSAFQMLLDLKEAVSERDTAEITRQMENIEKVLENLWRQTSVVGNRLTTLDAQKEALERISLEEQVRLSKVEDTDMLATISQLQAKSTTFEAALKVTGMLQGLNLTQYI